MVYDVLSQEEQDEIVVSFMLAQERDQFCHNLNRTRYELMLTTLAEGKWKQRVAELRAETLSRLGEVDSIIAATKPQLPDVARVAAAKARIKAKEARATPPV